jgi:hypothetical protein
MAVGVLAAETAGVEDDVAVVDIVAEPETAQAKPILAFTLSNAAEFKDVMLAGAVVGVLVEDGSRLVLVDNELGMGAGEIAR